MFDIMQLKKKYHRTKVLVVDDEPHIVATLGERLEMNGYKVFRAYDGREGLSTAIKDKPDIILLDLIMPVMDGFEMLRKLRETPEGKGTSVIIVTAKREERDIEMAKSENVDDYIIKPFDLSELIGKIEQIVEQRKAAAGRS